MGNIDKVKLTKDHDIVNRIVCHFHQQLLLLSSFFAQFYSLHPVLVVFITISPTLSLQSVGDLSYAYCVSILGKSAGES